MKENLLRLVGKVKLGAKRNAPELLLGGALVTGTATVILASKATLKSQDIKEARDFDLHDLNFQLEQHRIDDEDAKREIKRIYMHYAYKLAKQYAIPAGLYAATVAMIFSSYKIQKNRNMALSTALASCTAAYSSLVNKLKRGAAFGLTAKEVLAGVEGKDVVDPETGEISIEKVQGDRVKDSYEFLFDRYSTCWAKDKFQNEATLRGEENWANDRLRLQGYVFLNDILDRLGIPRTNYGQFVGWVYKDGSEFIDFGIEDCDNLDDYAFEGDGSFKLNFNVQGDIINRFKDVELF